MVARLFTSPNNDGKTEKEGKNTEGKTTTNLGGTTRTTSTATIKRNTRVEEEAKEKETEPHKTPNHPTKKRLPCADKEGKTEKEGKNTDCNHDVWEAEETAAQ